MNYAEVISRADKRLKAISSEISDLKNEEELLKRIQQSCQLEFAEAAVELLQQYRGLYKK